MLYIFIYVILNGGQLTPVDSCHFAFARLSVLPLLQTNGNHLSRTVPAKYSHHNLSGMAIPELAKVKGPSFVIYMSRESKYI